MYWWDFASAFLLGVGLVMGRFRRKDKNKPLNGPAGGAAAQGAPGAAPGGGARGAARGKLGMWAALVLLVSSLLGTLTIVGGWAASMGSWLAVSFILAAIVLTTTSGMLVAGVVLDLKDGVPDRRTLLACICGPQIVMIALGAFLGAGVHDTLVNQIKVTQAEVFNVAQGGR
ncbi:hypothetical protein FXF51_02305 [Nonomuraea sp. PA05]|uniref:hypothetical protein n=1 Tax=Nonomuraea sp. PA05 TaxID=2604466 RepID=UPI0011D67D99|nr:hypothetical protein [Nonomuraea sp. PA05]TYB71286.1 hypothetical protein FXF51_02305 [Nonomuraea sp. PA05]